jgi:HTH-type transcriptional regulator/antitoxin HigA
MDKRGYFTGNTYNGKNKESLLSAFFKNHIPTATQLAWKKTSRLSVRTDDYALLAWAEFIENKANSVQVTNKYTDGTVNLAFMQQVIKFSVKENGPLLAQEFLKQHGIVLVTGDHLPKTRVDGVTILKDKSKPIIGLSLRFDRVDNFWFTLLHELAHIALHLNREGTEIIFDELEEGLGISISEDEKEADALAQIIPSAMAAQSLANELGIHISVVAGFIRHKHQNYIYLKQIVHGDNAKVRYLFNNQTQEEGE